MKPITMWAGSHCEKCIDLYAHASTHGGRKLKVYRVLFRPYDIELVEVRAKEGQ